MNLFIRLIAMIMLVSAVAQAETSLSCRNAKNLRAAPVMTARILNHKYLSQVEFDFYQYPLKEYFINEKKELPNRPGKFLTRFGYLENPEGRLEPVEIENNRSPYKGNNEYTWEFGQYKSSRPPNKADRTNYVARLILPTDLSNDNLKTFRFKNRKSQKVNAVIIMNPPRHVHQYGDNFLKMFCTSD